uniref:CCHC-type domain-containing protein n=1 Tax=Peronospora matthiolae TaxID=2874970 RepID=A0AAV1U0I3_9STRA
MTSDQHAQLLQSMVATMEKQSLLLEQFQRSTQLSEIKLEGVKLPTYGGRLDESFLLYKEQVEQYFFAKGVNWKCHELSLRILAILGGTLKHGAAQWYVMQKQYITIVDDFFFKIEREFVPADLQERLREEMNDMRERDCKDLPDYVGKFRHVVTQVQDMSELDRIMYFLRGLSGRTREEVQYRRCTTLSDAITVALDFDRSHPTRYSRGRSQDKPRYRSYDNNRRYQSNTGPEPMDVSTVQIPSRDECRRRNLCFKCGSPNHRSAQCHQRPTRSVRENTNARRNYQHQEHRQHVNNVDSREDDQDTSVYDRVTINVVGVQKDSEVPFIAIHSSSSGADIPAQSRLLVRDGVIGNKPVKILIDSGASTNLIKPGLASTVLSEQMVQARRCDGTWTSSQPTKQVEDTILIDGMEFPMMQFTEWDLPDTHDLIFGQPWFTMYNPQIIWRTQQIEVAAHTTFKDVDGPTFHAKMTRGAYEEISQLKVTTIDHQEIPHELQPVLDEYKDVFPDQLPEVMPPTRSVNFELQLKPDAVPSSRAPFRLSKVEQEALQQFVEENIRKGWIEVSNSPWVSNIFGIPKRIL